MVPMIRCRVCGYLAPENKVGDKCAACGAPRAAFEPYKDRISERRRKLLELHLHPMLVHFPQALAVAVFGLSLAPLVFSGRAEELLFATLLVLAPALPASAAAAIATGLFHGRLRFKQVRRSPILKRKIVLGSVLLASSLVEAWVVWLPGRPGAAVIASIVLAATAFFSSLRLGSLGSLVANSEMPGD